MKVAIAHVSDTHFHGDPKKNEAVLRRISAIKERYEIRIENSDVIVMVVTGDVTDDGKGEQILNAETGLKIGEVQVLVVPGNHDYGVLGSAYSPASARAFDALAAEFQQESFFEKVPRLVKIGKVLFILLNSCQKTSSPFDLASGRIGSKQLGLLSKHLSDPRHEALVKVVALHHHPFIHNDPGMKLVDADEFMRVIYRKVDILLFGHKHDEGYWHEKSGCREISAAGALFSTDIYKELLIDEAGISVKKIVLPV